MEGTGVMRTVKETETGKIFAFKDKDGVFVLDKKNSKPYKVNFDLSDIQGLESVVDSTKRVVATSDDIDYMRVQLCVTHLCPLQCTYCKLDGENVYGKNVRMDLETAKTALEKVLEYKPKHVKKIIVSLTSNGETLTNFNMVENLIDYCNETTKDKDYKFSFNFATNAVLLNEDLVDRILKHDNLTLFFSLDGREDVHNKLRPYKGTGKETYQDVVSKINLYNKKAREKGRKSISSSSVITTYSLDIIDSYKHLIDMGFDRIVTRPVRGPKEWGFALSNETLDDYKKAYSKFYEFLKEGVDKGDHTFIKAMAPVYDFFGRPFYMMLLNERRYHGCPHCPPDTKDLKPYSVTFDSNGDIVSPCRDLIGIEQFKVGTLKEGFNEEKLGDITKFYNEKCEDCNNCWDEYLCGGGCYMVAYYNNKGDISHPDKVMCDLTKFTAKLAMKLVTYIEKKDPEFYKELVELGKRKSPWQSKYGC